MFRIYPLIIILQVFCLYHAYKNRTDQKWFWIILFFPLIGCLIYVYDQFYSKRKLENIAEGVKASFISNYAIDKLEQKVKFSDTFTNKMELATEHMKVGNHDRAQEVLETCYSGKYENDPELNMKLLQTHYLKEDYEAVVKYGSNLLSEKDFKNSPEKTAYAWSLYRLGRVDEANDIFKAMDINYCNYKNRLEYAYFLEKSQSGAQAMAKVEELLDEIEAMDNYEKKRNKPIIKSIKQYYKEL